MQKINIQTLNKSLNLSAKPKEAELIKATRQWLTRNVSGKYLITKDGKKVVFSSDMSVSHLSYDARHSKIYALAVPYIPEVLALGEPLGKQELTKARGGDFVAFYAWKKWVNVGNREILMKVKAGQKANGDLEVLPSLIAYTFQISRKNGARSQSPLTAQSENQRGIAHTASGQQKGQSATSEENDTLVLDDAQQKISAMDILNVIEYEPVIDEVNQKLNLLFARYSWN